MISLNYRDSRPIYEQIKDGLKKLIVSGAMAPDEKLPSVRALATQLSINPNTIQRAYNELENEGFIYSIPGRAALPPLRWIPVKAKSANWKTKFGKWQQSCGIWASARRSCWRW